MQIAIDYQPTHYELALNEFWCQHPRTEVVAPDHGYDFMVCEDCGAEYNNIDQKWDGEHGEC